MHCLTAPLYGAFRFIKTYRMHAIITRDLYIFIPFFTAVYIVEWFVLQTIYVLNKEILQYLSLKSAIYNYEQFQIKSGLLWRMYGI